MGFKETEQPEANTKTLQETLDETDISQNEHLNKKLLTACMKMDLSKFMEPEEPEEAEESSF